MPFKRLGLSLLHTRSPELSDLDTVHTTSGASFSAPQEVVFLCKLFACHMSPGRTFRLISCGSIHASLFLQVEKDDKLDLAPLSDLKESLKDKTAPPPKNSLKSGELPKVSLPKFMQKIQDCSLLIVTNIETQFFFFVKNDVMLSPISPNILTSSLPAIFAKPVGRWLASIKLCTLLPFPEGLGIESSEPYDPLKINL